MAIYDFFLSRNNAAANVAAYVGHPGRLFYDSNVRSLRISDGSTPGGLAVVPPVATITTVGGIKAGPGANVSVDGTLTIDTAGLPLSIGNLLISDTVISTVNANQDVFLRTNGSGNVSLIGEVHFYKPDGFPPTEPPIFRVKNDGQLRILVPAEDPVEGGIEIVGSATGTYVPPGQPGTMLHMTGNPDVPARLYIDSLRNYSSLVARRYNGNVGSPGQVLAGEDVFRINATAATNAGMGNVALAQIRMSALENQTATAQGSQIVFTATPVGSAATSRVDVANVSVANGVWATKFTTAGTVSATGNITGGNISTAGQVTATGNITGGNISTAGQVTATGNITTANTFVGNLSGLVTHRVRDAGSVGGTTLTLNVTTDDIVRCTFTTDFTVAFSNIVAGRVITLIATNTSGADTDVITSGIAALNTTSAGTFTVSPQTTAIITYYSLDGDTANIYASAVYG